MVPASHDRQVEVRLRDREIRYTKGRKAVVRALFDSDGPKSAAELHQDLRSLVPLSSLYRSLAVLEEAGVIAPHHGKVGTRYELAEWLAGHHHHLVCTDCGVVEDVDIPEGRETQLRELIRDLARAASFTATDHALEIEGRCARCV